MRDYAILCEGTRKYASLASVCEAPFCARYASSHARKYAPTPLDDSTVARVIHPLTRMIHPLTRPGDSSAFSVTLCVVIRPLTRVNCPFPRKIRGYIRYSFDDIFNLSLAIHSRASHVPYI